MKTAVITGSSRGIGRETALRLARDGWSLALHYHKNEPGALALREHIRSMGCDAEVFSADVADRNAVLAMRDAVGARFGPPQLLVCNAGIAQQKLFTDITEEDWQNMLNVDLGGVFHCCQAFLPAMIARKSGRIVTLSSIWGIQGASCEVHYSAAKAGVIGLTRALAQEVGPSGVTVNCVAPGVIDTDMCAHLSPEDRAELRGQIPLGRLGAPGDVAEVIAFLASDAAGYLTGQVISPNGGMVLA